MIWLLDTNALIHAINGVPAVRDRLNRVSATDRVITSVLVVGELIYGAECSVRRDQNRSLVEERLSHLEVVDVTRPVVERFAVLKAQLRRMGRPKADVDLLIAATAIEHQAVVVTDDTGLLQGDIPGLAVENWL